MERINGNEEIALALLNKEVYRYGLWQKQMQNHRTRIGRGRGGLALSGLAAGLNRSGKWRLGNVSIN